MKKKKKSLIDIKLFNLFYYKIITLGILLLFLLLLLSYFIFKKV